MIPEPAIPFCPPDTDFKDCPPRCRRREAYLPPGWAVSIQTSTPPVTVRRIGVGQSNLTYPLSDAEGHRWVLRRPPMGHLLDSAHDVLREARILSSLASTGVPVPRIYGVAQAGEIGDGPVVLMEFVDGVVISDAAASQTLSARARHTTGIALAETLGRIHAVDLGAVNLTDWPATHRTRSGN